MVNLTLPASNLHLKQAFRKRPFPNRVTLPIMVADAGYVILPLAESDGLADNEEEEEEDSDGGAVVEEVTSGDDDEKDNKENRTVAVVSNDTVDLHHALPTSQPLS